MSVIIGLKYKDGILLAADKQSTHRGIKTDNSTKIKKFEKSNTAIGVVGLARGGEIIRVQDEIISSEDIINRTPLNYKYIVLTLVNKLFNLLKDNHCMNETGDTYIMNNEMIFIADNKIYSIEADGACTEGTDYIVIGCGDEQVMGYLNTIENINNLNRDKATEIIKKCIQSACKDDIYIDDKIDIIDMKF